MSFPAFLSMLKAIRQQQLFYILGLTPIVTPKKPAFYEIKMAAKTMPVTTVAAWLQTEMDSASD